MIFLLLVPLAGAYDQVLVPLTYGDQAIIFVGSSDLHAYFDQQPSMRYLFSKPTVKDYALRNIDNAVQKKALQPLVHEIEKKSSDPQEQAMIAIQMVQNIPYDWESYHAGTLKRRYAYDVLYDNTGVCGEKSELLVFLLRELGFGVALFHYEEENHLAVAVECDDDYGSGYCLVETNVPSEINEQQSTLYSEPKLFALADGRELKN